MSDRSTPNHQTEPAGAQEREGGTPSGIVEIAPQIVDLILGFGPVFTKTSDGVAVCITAQRMLTTGEREFLPTDTLADHARKLSEGQ